MHHHSLIIPKKETCFRSEMPLITFQSPEAVCGSQQALNRRWEIPAAWGNTGKPKGSTPPTTSTAGLGWLELREGARTECTEPQCSADKDKFREWQPIKLAKQTNMKGRPATRSRAPEDKDPNPRLSCHHSTFCILKPQAVPQGSRAHSFPALSHKGGYRNIHWHHSHPSRRLLSN